MGSQDVAPRCVGNGAVGGCGSQDVASRSGPRKAGNDPAGGSSGSRPGSSFAFIFLKETRFSTGGAGPRREDFADPPPAINPSDLEPRT